MPRVVEMSKRYLNNVIRLIKLAPMTQVSQLRSCSYHALKRLGVKRDLSMAREGVPHGSDQWNSRTVIEWMEKIAPEDKKAISQLVVIDATAVKRTKGI